MRDAQGFRRGTEYFGCRAEVVSALYSPYLDLDFISLRDLAITRYTKEHFPEQDALLMKRLTQQDMTESEQRELKTLLDRGRKAQGRDLTNSETNRIKDDYVDKLMAEREKEASKVRAEKRRAKINATPSTSATYNWTASTHPRGRR